MRPWDEASGPSPHTSHCWRCSRCGRTDCSASPASSGSSFGRARLASFEATMTDADPLPRYRANLQGEVDGAAVYGALADSEKDPKLAAVFRKLAAVEAAHGAFWQSRMGTQAAQVLPAPSVRARLLAWLARRFGPGFRSEERRVGKGEELPDR